MTTPQILQPIPPGDGSGGVLPSSFVIGDILYADSTSTLHTLAAVAAGSVLVSAGVGAAPAWSATSNSKFGSVAIGGATIGTDALAVTGTETHNGAVTFAANGVASVSPVLLSGTILASGTGTTNFPAILIQPSGTTAASSWSTFGTGLGMNLASGFAGNFLDFQKAGGGSQFTVSSGGAVFVNGAISTNGNIAAATGSRVTWNADTGLSRDSVLGAGNLDLGNGSANDKTGTLNLAKIVFSTAASGIVLKQGANGLCGTFVANGVTPVTVSNTNVAITDAIIISLNTVGGTVGANPPDVQTITAGVGFTVKGLTLDTSTYNYAIIKNAA